MNESGNEEYRALMDQRTWELVPLPPGKNLVKTRWLFDSKYLSSGKLERLKARLVAKGYSQIERDGLL